MPILDKVKDAEAKAEELRKQAQVQVEENLKMNDLSNKEKTDKLFKEAEAKIIEMNANAKRKIIELEKDYADSTDILCEKDKSLAKANQKNTIDFIIKKVIDS